MNHTSDLTERDALLDSVESQESGTGQNDGQERTIERDSCLLWKVLSVSAHTIVQTLIGANVIVTLWFAFKSTPITKFHLHIGLSVIGYQLLIAHGILCLHSNGWSSLSLKHRRRVHWILQVSGSVLAIARSALMIKSKTDDSRAHFNSIHAKCALAALILTCASLINGLLSLYAVELRHWIPAKVSKISHIILGGAAFATSSASLALGFNKKSFVEWSSQEFAYVMIGVVTVYTVLIIVMPLNKVFKRFVRFWKIKIC